MRSKSAALLLAGLVATLAPTNAALANQPKSLYTTLEIKTCKLLRRHPDGNSWICPGLPGYPVYLAHGDLRTFVSYGPAPERRRAAKQTLAAFNAIHKAGRNRATIEWRIAPGRGKAIPRATILRYFTSRDGKRGEVLVVSKVDAREACHVAYVDALANRDAIAIARRLADEVAPRFDCSLSPKMEGLAGRSPL